MGRWRHADMEKKNRRGGQNRDAGTISRHHPSSFKTVTRVPSVVIIPHHSHRYLESHHVVVASLVQAVLKQRSTKIQSIVLPPGMPPQLPRYRRRTEFTEIS